jgi:hypothetical protein
MKYWTNQVPLLQDFSDLLEHANGHQGSVGGATHVSRDLFPGLLRDWGTATPFPSLPGHFQARHQLLACKLPVHFFWIAGT